MIPKKKNQAIENHIITVRLALMSLEMRENIIYKKKMIIMMEDVDDWCIFTKMGRRIWFFPVIYLSTIHLCEVWYRTHHHPKWINAYHTVSVCKHSSSSHTVYL